MANLIRTKLGYTLFSLTVLSFLLSAEGVFAQTHGDEPQGANEVPEVREKVEDGLAKKEIETEPENSAPVVDLDVANDPPQIEVKAEEEVNLVQKENVENAVEEDTVASDFNTRCSGCHTIGGGDMKGPDLSSSTQWSEEDLVMSIRKMQKHVGPIEPAEMKALAELLRDAKVKERLQAERERATATMAASYDAPDAIKGKALFFGATSLSNGGMSCSSCHAIGSSGGELGPDLTELKDRLPHVGMLSAFEGANFPVMRPHYKEHPVTKQEAIHLAGYFEELDVEPSTDKNAEFMIPISIGASLLFLFLIGIFLKDRGPAGVRARLVNNAQREVS